MANVIVTGIPIHAKLPVMITAVKRGLQRRDKNFWISQMTSSPDGDCNELTVEFRSFEEAEEACHLLDNQSFMYGRNTYRFGAYMEGAAPRRAPRRRSPNPMYERQDRRSTRGRFRSRSPLREEASKLDMELELLRKQRLVIEEERRLLMERKKLEVMKGMKAGSVRDYEFADRHSRRDRFSERDRARRGARWSPSRKVEPRERRKPTCELPKFVLPCQKLIAEMRVHFADCKTSKETGMLTDRIKHTLRKRLALALKDKEYTPTKQIYQLYRALHPKDKDEEFVTTELNNLRQLKEAKVPEDELLELIKDENNIVDEEGEAESSDPLDADLNDDEEEEETVDETIEADAQNNKNVKEKDADATATSNKDVKDKSDSKNDEKRDLADGKTQSPGQKAVLKKKVQDQDKNGEVEKNDSNDVELLLHDETDWGVGGEPWADDKEEVKE